MILSNTYGAICYVTINTSVHRVRESQVSHLRDLYLYSFHCFVFQANGHNKFMISYNNVQYLNQYITYFMIISLYKSIICFNQPYYRQSELSVLHLLLGFNYSPSWVVYYCIEVIRIFKKFINVRQKIVCFPTKELTRSPKSNWQVGVGTYKVKFRHALL